MRTYAAPAILASVILPLLGSAQAATVVINDFSSLVSASPAFDFSWSGGSPVADQYNQGSGFVSITPKNGGNPQDDGNFFVAPAIWSGGIDLTSGGTNSLIALTAQFDPGNLATDIVVIFSDTGLNQASATFTGYGSSFSKQSIAMADFSDAIDWTSIVDWSISGGAQSPDLDFRASFDKIEATAVPEPGAWALLAGSLTTVMVLRRRRFAF